MSDLKWEWVRGGKHPAYVLRAYETGVPPRGRALSYVVGGVRMTSRKRNKWRVYENGFMVAGEGFQVSIHAATDAEAMDTARVLLQGFVR